MANLCAKPIGGSMVEIVREDECGLILEAANNAMRTTGFLSLSLTADYEAGTEIVEYNANGDVCVNERGPASLKGFNASLRMCGISPVFLSFLLPDTTPILATTDSIGFSMKGGTKSTKNFHMKVWAPIPNCGNSATYKWMAYGFSRIQNPVLSGEIQFAKDIVHHAQVDFYVNIGNTGFTDPTGVFGPTELTDHVWAVKGVSTLPSATDCGLITIDPTP